MDTDLRKKSQRNLAQTRFKKNVLISRYCVTTVIADKWIVNNHYNMVFSSNCITTICG